MREPQRSEAAGAKNEVPLRLTQQPVMPALGRKEGDMLLSVNWLQCEEIPSVLQNLVYQFTIH